MIRLVLISDTHSAQRLSSISIPDGDVLIHAGDHTGRGYPAESEDALLELGKLKSRFKHVVAIAGNHDFLAEKQPLLWRKYCVDAGVVYLQDDEIILEGLKIYGSPWQPWFCDWAFNLDRGSALKEKWDMIPQALDVLITHGPPLGFLDVLGPDGSQPGVNIGCQDLLEAVKRLKPRLHVFGHIHEGYGKSQYESIKFANASICDTRYRAVNSPIVVDL